MMQYQSSCDELKNSGIIYYFTGPEQHCLKKLAPLRKMPSELPSYVKDDFKDVMLEPSRTLNLQTEQSWEIRKICTEWSVALPVPVVSIARNWDVFFAPS